MEDLIICRCMEVNKQEIIDAIKDGATSIDGVKRRTKACMGLCQGKTCSRSVQDIVARETGIDKKDIPPQKSRMPVRPIKIGLFKGENHE